MFYYYLCYCLPNTHTFTNEKSSLMNPVGTLAYVIDEEAVLVRVNKGWQYIAVSIKLNIAGYISLGWSLYVVHNILTVIFSIKKKENVLGLS